MEVLTRSPDRVEAPCPHAGPGRCGGCDYQHVSLGAQRRLKAARVEEQLRRLAGVERAVEVEPVPGDHGGLRWRSRVRLAVDRDGRAGFRRHRSHDVEPIADCPIADSAVIATGVFATRWPGAAEVEVVTGTVRRGGEPGGSALLADTLRRGARAHAASPAGALRPGLVVDGRVRLPPAAVETEVAGRSFRTSPGVFWQAHVGAPAALLGAVLDGVDARAGADVVDLYAGAGLFSVPLADAAGPSGRVLAIEHDRRAARTPGTTGAASTPSRSGGPR